jgi:DNA-binding NarL/FixJ family response regulator
MRFLLADGGAPTRFALCALLEQHPGWKVVGEVSSGDHLLEKVEAVRPDVLLIDWNLLAVKSEDCIPMLKESYPNLVIIVMSGRPELKMKACSKGADAFVSKTESPDKLLDAISSLSNEAD